MRPNKLLSLAASALLLASVHARAQTAPRHFLSAATNNSTLVLGRSSLLGMIQATNTTGTIYYLKFYNKTTAPTCGTDVPVLALAVPAGGSVLATPDGGLLFPLGVGFCLVAGIADNDDTSAATGVTINAGVSGR